MNKEPLFKKKQPEKTSELDQLNTYLKLSSISAWLILAAAVTVIIGIFMWGQITEIEETIQGAGECKNGVLTCYFRQEDMNEIKPGMQVQVNGSTYEIKEVVPKMLYTYDMPREILYLSQKTDWYQTALVPCDLADGTYKVRVVLGRNTPLGLMMTKD